MTTLERIPEGVAAPTTTVADVISLARESGVLIVDLRFVDLPGQAQHFSIPVRELSENLFIDGIGFDGSSIRGFQHIHESDMLLMPDPEVGVRGPDPRGPDPGASSATWSSRAAVSRTRAIRAISPRRPSASLLRRASPPRRTGARSSSSTSSTRSASTRPAIGACTRSIPKRASGTRARTGPPTWPIGRDPRRATSRSRRWTSSRICARACCLPCRRPGSKSRSNTTRSADPVRPRSISATGPWSRPPTRSSSTSTSSSRRPPVRATRDVHAQAAVR